MIYPPTPDLPARRGQRAIQRGLSHLPRGATRIHAQDLCPRSVIAAAGKNRCAAPRGSRLATGDPPPLTGDPRARAVCSRRAKVAFSASMITTSGTHGQGLRQPFPSAGRESPTESGKLVQLDVRVAVRCDALFGVPSSWVFLRHSSVVRRSGTSSPAAAAGTVRLILLQTFGRCSRPEGFVLRALGEAHCTEGVDDRKNAVRA